MPVLHFVTAVSAEIQLVDLTAPKVASHLLENIAFVGAHFDAECGPHAPAQAILRIRTRFGVEATFAHHESRHVRGRNLGVVRRRPRVHDHLVKVTERYDKKEAAFWPPLSL
jgi:hypothetical protein